MRNGKKEGGEIMYVCEKTASERAREREKDREGGVG